MIVLISPEENIPQEKQLLNRLFEAGLEYYHLRKPALSLREHCDYLDDLNAKYHARIVLHNHHEIARSYSLKGIHFREPHRKENMRKGANTTDFKMLRHLTISSSFHQPEELVACEIAFDYQFLSPVFNSISKPGYQGKAFDVSSIQKKVIGLGGITKNNIAQLKSWGYQGVGVLGSIWKSPTPLEDFETMKRAFETTTVQ